MSLPGVPRFFPTTIAVSGGKRLSMQKSDVECGAYLAHRVDLDWIFAAMSAWIAMDNHSDVFSWLSSPSYSEKNFREFESLFPRQVESYGCSCPPCRMLSVTRGVLSKFWLYSATPDSFLYVDRHAFSPLIVHFLLIASARLTWRVIASSCRRYRRLKQPARPALLPPARPLGAGKLQTNQT
jgi:hypothetical protein